MDAESGIRSVDREGFGWSPWLSFDIHMQIMILECPWRTEQMFFVYLIGCLLLS